MTCKEFADIDPFNCTLSETAAGLRHMETCEACMLMVQEGSKQTQKTMEPELDHILDIISAKISHDLIKAERYDREL